jgi:hypothetical protein
MRRILGARIARPIGGVGYVWPRGTFNDFDSVAFHLVYTRPRKDLRQATSLFEMK